MHVHSAHPGEILREDILPELNLTVTQTAKSLGIPRQMLHDILAERKPLSAAMCLRMAKLFGSSPEMWMRLQSTHDLQKAREDARVAASLNKIVPIREEEEAILPDVARFRAVRMARCSRSRLIQFHGILYKLTSGTPRRRQI